MAAGGDSAGGNAVTQRGEIFLGRGGSAGFGPGTTFGVSFVAQRSGLASARGGRVERRRARGIRVARTRRALRTTGGRGDGDSTRGVVAGIRCRKFSLRRVIRAIGKRRVDVRLGAGFLWAGRVVAGVG